jgi:siroheme synthase
MGREIAYEVSATVRSPIVMAAKAGIPLGHRAVAGMAPRLRGGDDAVMVVAKHQLGRHERWGRGS